MHQLDLLLAGVTRYVYVCGGVVDDAHTHFGQLVDNASHQLFVSGNCAGREYHEVGKSEHDLAVIAKRHAVQSRHGLALATGGDQGQLLGLIALDVIDVNQHAVRHFHVTEGDGGGNNIDHAASRDRDLTLMTCADVNDLLHAVHIRREGRNDDALIGVHGEDGFQ